MRTGSAIRLTLERKQTIIVILNLFNPYLTFNQGHFTPIKTIIREHKLWFYLDNVEAQD